MHQYSYTQLYNIKSVISNQLVNVRAISHCEVSAVCETRRDEMLMVVMWCIEVSGSHSDLSGEMPRRQTEWYVDMHKSSTSLATASAAGKNAVNSWLNHWMPLTHRQKHHFTCEIIFLFLSVNLTLLTVLPILFIQYTTPPSSSFISTTSLSLQTNLVQSTVCWFPRDCLSRLDLTGLGPELLRIGLVFSIYFYVYWSHV